MSTNTIKNIYNHLDLYGSDVLIDALKASFKSVAMTKRSIPGPGSRCGKSEGVKSGLTIKKLIFHKKKNEITVFTDKGNLRFF